MRQLSSQDAVFFYADNPHANGNVTLLHIYDQSTAPGGVVRFKSILAHIESRLEQLPILRQRVKQAPLGLDRPYWVEDEDFNLEYHVRHIALPKPGDWRQFCIQASRIHARPLDLNRPLWEMYVIEGLDSFLDLPKGSFALLLKIHHAAIEVEHGCEITELLHDLTPDVRPPGPLEPWFPEAPPNDLMLLARAAVNTALFPFSRLWPMARAVAGLAPALFERVMDGLRPNDHAIVTRFNSVVSPHRVFDTRRFPMDEFAAVQNLARGATIDDAAFAICGGALRRYLDMQGELPDVSLTASIPTSLQAADPDGAHGFEWMRARLGTDIDDPVARLESIRDQMAAAKAAAVGDDFTDVARYAPAPTISLTSKMLAYASAQLGRWAPAANCAIAHVPGPEHPLYLVGARMTYYSAILPIADGMGLVFALTRYDDKINLSFTGCYEQIPDPESFAQCMRDSFQEYLAIARARESAQKAAKKPVGKPARKAPPRRKSVGKVA